VARDETVTRMDVGSGRNDEDRVGGGARSPLAPLAPTTLVEQVADAIVEAAAQGHFLPGDRIVEAEIARRLEVSRVPVREALRLLESQGIVVNTPYRGMRLMDVSTDRLEKILEVRLALERLAAQRVLEKARATPSLLEPLARIVGEMGEAARTGNGYQVAFLDTAFHRELCALSGNEILVQTWEPLWRQLTIIFGLSTLQKGLEPIVEEHVDLLAALRAGDRAELERLMDVHILEYTRALDYEGFVARLRDVEKSGS